MSRDFGSLLRYYRKDRNDLTQEGLAEELKLELDTDVKYTKTDISKWEKGKRIPAEHVVEVLDKVLSAGDVLIKAAGYIVQLPESQKPEPTDLPRLQMEHVAKLQELALSMADGVLKVIDDIKRMNMEQFEASGSGALFHAFERIFFHSLWPSLRDHLENHTESFEALFPDKLGRYIFPRESALGKPLYQDEVTFEEFKMNLVEDITERVADLANFGTYGTFWDFENPFKPRCPYCPARKNSDQ
jgi:transcriptional regulator with XRE-family HTH domain